MELQNLTATALSAKIRAGETTAREAVLCVFDRIAEKEELINAFKTRLKSEQGELEALYREKREKDLEGLSRLLDSTGLLPDEAADVLKEYAQNHGKQQSA